MKFGISTWVWVSPATTRELERLVPHVAEMGFDMIEVPIENTDDIDYARAAEVIRDHNLDVSVCVMMSPDRDLIHPEAKVRENAVAYVRHCIEATQALGGTNLVGPLYSAVGRVWLSTPEERERDMDLLVQQLRTLAEYAADHGVVLCIEPLNRFTTSFIYMASQAVEVVERVGHPACQIMLDTFHMNIEERSLGDTIRAVGPHLHHLQVAENDRSAPGQGHIPWSEVATALQEINYDGPVVFEGFTPEVKSLGLARAGGWRPLASSQDALAQQVLASLRQLLA